MISRFWPKTRRAWLSLALFAAAFFVLDALALAGVELAVGLLITLGGGFVGIPFALALAYPFVYRLPEKSPWRFVWFCMGWISVFGIIFGGSALAGIPPFPTAEGGNIGVFVYGLALGFGLSVCNFALGGGWRSAFTGILHEDEELRSIRLRFILVVLGAIAGLLCLCLLGYFAIEYIVAPLARSFA